MFVDIHEPDKIFNLLDRQKVKYERKALPIGDFVEGNVCIERKFITDFITSIRSGHLQKQLLQMEENFDRPFLIISGKKEDLAFKPHFRNWTRAQHNGALAHLIRYSKLKVFQVSNDSQLVDLVIRIIEKSFDGKVVTIMDTELMRNNILTDDVKLCMLCGIPGIGLEKAKRLRNHINILLLNKDCTNICNSGHIMNLSGFGEMTAKKILNLHLLLPIKKQEIRKNLALGYKNGPELIAAIQAKVSQENP